MKKFNLLSLVLLMVISFSFQLLPMAAQELGSITVTGTFDYTPSIVARGAVDGSMYMATTEVEVWLGDIDGTGLSDGRAMITPSGAWQVHVITTFDEVQIDDKTGGMVQLSIWTRPSATAPWHGEWVILSGTGDLENLHGSGTAWGPGFNPQDPEASPDIFYTGELVFIEASSD